MLKLPYLAVAGHRAEGDFPELLLHEGPVGDAPYRDALLGEHDGAVVAIEDEADDVLLRHLGQLLVEDLLESIENRRVARGLGHSILDAG